MPYWAFSRTFLCLYGRFQCLIRQGIVIAMKIYRDFFSSQLRAALKLKGLTQEQFAEKMEINQSSLNKWLTAKNFPEDDKFDLICKKLEMDPRYFMPWVGTPKHEKEMNFARQLAAAIDPSGLDINDFLFIVENLKNIPGQLLVMLCKINNPGIYRQIRGIIEPMVKPETKSKGSAAR